MDNVTVSARDRATSIAYNIRGGFFGSHSPSELFLSRSKGLTMSKDAELLFEAVLKLAEEDRAELASRLIDSLDGDFADKVVAASWHAEIDRRTASVDSGASDTVPWPEAWRQMMTDENG